MMTDPATQSFISSFREAGVTGIPCDEWEITQLQQDLGLELPPAYKAFLAIAGNGFAPLEGSHYALKDDLSELQKDGQRIAAREKSTLPAGAFVFLVHQGFACLFFVLHDMDDPAVFECVEGGGPPRAVSLRFSDWVREQLASSRALKG
jgi:hypothetical protein